MSGLGYHIEAALPVRLGPGEERILAERVMYCSMELWRDEKFLHLIGRVLADEVAQEIRSAGYEPEGEPDWSAVALRWVSAGAAVPMRLKPCPADQADRVALTVRRSGRRAQGATQAP